MEKLLALNTKTTMTSCKNNQVFYPSIDLFTMLDEKVHFHFTFPSKHGIVTNYSCICDFIRLYQHYSFVCDYSSRIYDYTHLWLKWHIGLTQL
jgi:hypothetical protein